MIEETHRPAGDNWSKSCKIAAITPMQEKGRGRAGAFNWVLGLKNEGFMGYGPIDSSLSLFLGAGAGHVKIHLVSFSVILPVILHQVLH